MSRTLKLFLPGCAALIAAAAGCAVRLSALKAAGLSGIAPRGGNAFVGLVRELQQNPLC
jgi:hypothetical protein